MYVSKIAIQFTGKPDTNSTAQKEEEEEMIVISAIDESNIEPTI